ncbi:MAG: non-canonical purine NTP pyrophosphatase [Treponema sp.]|jgi:XTP/dITP diphosphohydrolase|nr:non-canonical purine NTP pyrophosphatase [Treponema sp.]
MTLWFASGNAHKKQELQAILGESAENYRIMSPAEAGIAFDPLESGSDFLENALIKARALYRILAEQGKAAPVIADDSGLCVDALGGKPGIRSARYGSTDGKKLKDAERNALLLSELGDNPLRKARFVCAMALLLSEDRFYVVQETLEGEIITPDLGLGRGTGGFGYDPLLYLPDRGLTVAELTPDEKKRLSHRGKAGRAIAAFLT